MPHFQPKKLYELYGQLGNLLHLEDSFIYTIDNPLDLDKMEKVVLEAYNYLEQFREVDELLKVIKF